jgi:hypothetical protein
MAADTGIETILPKRPDEGHEVATERGLSMLTARA